MRQHLDNVANIGAAKDGGRECLPARIRHLCRMDCGKRGTSGFGLASRCGSDNPSVGIMMS